VAAATAKTRKTWIQSKAVNTRTPEQGCRMVSFQTKKIPILGKFWTVLQWKTLVYFMTIWSILRPLKIFSGHLVYFVIIWYIFPRFGILYQEKSDYPAPEGSFLNRFSRLREIVMPC
jgi:hypothetical protein